MKIHIPMDDFPLIFPIFQWAPLFSAPLVPGVPRPPPSGRQCGDRGRGCGCEPHGAAGLRGDAQGQGPGGWGVGGVGDGGLKSYRNQIKLIGFVRYN